MTAEALAAVLSPAEHSTEASSLDSAARRRELTAERVRLLAERSRDAVLGALAGCALVVAVVRPHVPATWLAGWLLVYVLCNGYRLLLARSLMNGTRAADERALGRYLGIAVLNGLWLAALSLMFFPGLPLESKITLTVLVLLSIAGSAATYSSYPRGYMVYIALAMPAIIWCWARHGAGTSGMTVFALAIYGAMMVGFSRYIAVVFERSVEIRFQREEVVRALIAEQKRAESAARSKSRFLANASHDLRQPAQALALYTAVLQHSASTPEEAELADNIAQASKALGGLLNNLLDLSRLDAGAVQLQPTSVDVQRLVSRLGQEAAGLGAAKGLAVTFDCPPLILYTDPLLLERLLRNLLDNALKFTDAGHISLTANADANGCVRFVVEDTGCGIAPQYQQTIFEEFFQIDNPERDRERGLGLGLSIVSRLGRILNGRVQVSSTLGRGSSFYFAVPNAARGISEAPTGAPVPFGTPNLRGMRALVLDDDPMVRHALARLLGQWGAEVDAVDTLAWALRLSASARWHFCLCDLRLRESEDGLDAAVRLRDAQPGLPVIFISGDTAPQRIESATRTGHPLLHKPIDAQGLAQEIMRLGPAQVTPPPAPRPEQQQTQLQP